MVGINEVRQINAEFYTKPLVAVFIGGTQGIGRYAVEALSNLYLSEPQASLRVYIVGRNKSSANEILKFCAEQCPHGEFIFIPADNLARIRDVDATCKKIVNMEREREIPRIDLLVQTQAQILFGARKDTGEGLDQMMSLVYYSRIRFIMQLMPLLEASTYPNGAHVVSIDAAGTAGKLFRDDLSLRDPKHYSYVNVKSHAAYMTTMAFEHLASQHQHVSFVYMYPGMVLGPSYDDPSLPWWFKTIIRGVAVPLLRWTFATPPEDSGSRTLYLATPRFVSAGSEQTINGVNKGTNGARGSGCYAVGYQCDPIAHNSDTTLYAHLRDDGFSKEVWTHSIQAFRETEEAGKVTVRI